MTGEKIRAFVEELLLYAYIAPVFTRKELLITLSTKASSVMAHISFTRLLDNGLIEPCTENDKYYRITPAGITFLNERDGYFAQHRDDLGYGLVRKIEDVIDKNGHHNICLNIYEGNKRRKNEINSEGSKLFISETLSGPIVSLSDARDELLRAFKAFDLKYISRPARLSEIEYRKDRDYLTAAIIGAGAIYYPWDKPSFAEFVKTATGKDHFASDLGSFAGHSGYAHATPSELNALLANGIYYDIDEIRTALKYSGTKKEEFTGTRACGVLFTAKDIYIFHRETEKGFIWTAFDTRFTTFVTEYFGARWNLGSRDDKKTPILVCTGKSYSAAVEIVTGEKAGRAKEEEKKRLELEEKLRNANEFERPGLLESRKERMLDFFAKQSTHYQELSSNPRTQKIVAAAMYRLFNQIYYLPINFGTGFLLGGLGGRDGKEDGGGIIYTSRDNLISEANDWYNVNDNFEPYLSNPRSYGSEYLSGLYLAENKKIPAIYMPFFECAAISDIRLSPRCRSVVVATYPDIADAISRCLGEKLLLAVDIDTGEELQIARYAYTGYPLGRDRYKESARISAEKRAERKGYVPPRKKTSVDIDRKLYARVKNYADASNTTIGSLIERCVSIGMQHLEEETDDPN